MTASTRPEIRSLNSTTELVIRVRLGEDSCVSGPAVRLEPLGR